MDIDNDQPNIDNTNQINTEFDKFAKLKKSEKILLHINRMIKIMHKPVNRQLKFIDEKKYRMEIQQKCDELFKMYPSIFNLVFEKDGLNEADGKRLLQMFSVYDKVEEKKVTEEQATAYIGEEYFREFVKPIVDTTPADKDPNKPNSGPKIEIKK